MSSLVSVNGSALPSNEATRRHLSPRQAATVERLTTAAVEELHEVSYEGLTVRSVARRAGVAPATAYTYFTSKDHLVAEIFWRRLRALPDRPVDRRRTLAGRVTAALSDVALLVADEPELSSAVSIAMLGRDPDVRDLRDRIGAAMHRRIVLALGDDPDRVVLQTLDLVLTGALLRAGMGYLAYTDLPGILGEAVDAVLGGRK